MFPEENIHFVISKMYLTRFSTCSTHPSSPSTSTAPEVRNLSQDTLLSNASLLHFRALATASQKVTPKVRHIGLVKEFCGKTTKSPCLSQDLRNSEMDLVNSLLSNFVLERKSLIASRRFSHSVLICAFLDFGNSAFINSKSVKGSGNVLCF